MDGSCAYLYRGVPLLCIGQPGHTVIGLSGGDSQRGDHVLFADDVRIRCPGVLSDGFVVSVYYPCAFLWNPGQKMAQPFLWNTGFTCYFALFRADSGTGTDSFIDF